MQNIEETLKSISAAYKNLGSKNLTEMNYAHPVTGRALDIASPSSYIHPDDIYLLTLALKNALGDKFFDPLLEEVNHKKIFYHCESNMSLLERLSPGERKLLSERNKVFKKTLLSLLEKNRKFNIIIGTSGLDGQGSVHYINVNIDNKGNGNFAISVDDSFSPLLDQTESAAYRNRLQILFSELLDTTQQKVDLQINQVKLQEAANCGIHALVNKINNDYSLKTSAEDAEKLVQPLRNAIKSFYNDFNVEKLLTNVKNALPKSLTAGAAPAEPKKEGNVERKATVERKTTGESAGTAAGAGGAGAASSVSKPEPGVETKRTFEKAQTKKPLNLYQETLMGTAVQAINTLSSLKKILPEAIVNNVVEHFTTMAEKAVNATNANTIGTLDQQIQQLVRLKTDKNGYLQAFAKLGIALKDPGFIGSGPLKAPVAGAGAGAAGSAEKTKTSSQAQSGAGGAGGAKETLNEYQKMLDIQCKDFLKKLEGLHKVLSESTVTAVVDHFNAMAKSAVDNSNPDTMHTLRNQIDILVGSKNNPADFQSMCDQIGINVKKGGPKRS